MFFFLRKSCKRAESYTKSTFTLRPQRALQTIWNEILALIGHRGRCQAIQTAEAATEVADRDDNINNANEREKGNGESKTRHEQLQVRVRPGPDTNSFLRLPLLSSFEID